MKQKIIRRISERTCHPFVLALDFDGTLCYSDYPRCGNETPVCGFVRSVQDMDYVQILVTCREGDALLVALDWCREHGIRIDYANENEPSRIERYGDCRKIYADMLIDDCAYGFDMDDFR